MKVIKILIFLGIFISISSVAFLPSSSLAQITAQDNTTNSEGINATDIGSTNFTKLHNPLEGNNIDSIPKLVRALLDIVLTIAVPIIAVAIIYTGFLFIAAQGNPEKLKAAKQTLLYVLIGAAILLAAYVIAEAIESTISAITG